MLEHVPFGVGRLARPLLGFTRTEIVAQARASGLRWLDDPANDDPRHDRSFLRRDVVPALVARWSAAARSAQRLAEQMTDAEAILDAVAERDAEPIDDPGPRPARRARGARARAAAQSAAPPAAPRQPRRAERVAKRRSCATRCSTRGPTHNRASVGGRRGSRVTASSCT